VGTTVYPEDQVDSGVRKWLEENHPQALFVFHPAFKRWLMFELPKGSSWTAQRLYEAMAEHHAHAVNNGHVGVPKWARDRGAPVMRGELKAPPGNWLLDLLRRNDLWKHGHKEWLDDIEADEAAKEQAAEERISDMNHEVAYESTAPLHLADALRGDPLAGKRKWRTSVQKELVDDVGREAEVLPETSGGSARRVESGSGSEGS
jgi:hypothetical protein